MIPLANQFYEDWLLASNGLIPAILQTHEQQKETAESITGHIGGLVAVGASYAAIGFLVVIDGPLPFGDAIAVGIALVPDPVWYGLGYWLTS